MILTITPGTGCEYTFVLLSSTLGSSGLGAKLILFSSTGQNGAVRCGTNGSGSGCGSTNSCPTGVTDYVLAFC
jgi:hypothetical protein